MRLSELTRSFTLVENNQENPFSQFTLNYAMLVDNQPYMYMDVMYISSQAIPENLIKPEKKHWLHNGIVTVNKSPLMTDLLIIFPFQNGTPVSSLYSESVNTKLSHYPKSATLNGTRSLCLAFMVTDL